MEVALARLDVFSGEASRQGTGQRGTGGDYDWMLGSDEDGT